MKIFIILFIIFFTGSNTYAQQTIEITYSQTRVSEGSSLYHLIIPKVFKPAYPWHSIITEDTTLFSPPRPEKGKGIIYEKAVIP